MNIGDKVLVRNSTYGKNTISKGLIVDETKQCWKVQTGKDAQGQAITQLFYKEGVKNSLQLRGEGDWLNVRIEVWNEEEWQTYINKIKKNNTIIAITRMNLNKFPIEYLQKIVDDYSKLP